MNQKLYEEGYTQNRELSWLRFNKRVMDEAKNAQVPLLERLKFLAIHASNLNEFFSVRCGSLYEMNRLNPKAIDHKSGLSAKEQLHLIYDQAKNQYTKRNVLYQKICKQMRDNQIMDLSYNECTREEQRFLRQYFKRVLYPLITPSVADISHPLPVLKLDTVYVVGMVKDKTKGKAKEKFFYVKVPDQISNIVVLPKKDSSFRFVHIEDVIAGNIKLLSYNANVSDILKISITRSADVDLEDDTFEDIKDYRERMLKVLKKRKRMGIVKLDLSKKPSAKMYRYLIDHLKVSSDMVFITRLPLSMKYAFQLPDLMTDEQKEKNYYPVYTPKLSKSFDYNADLFGQICKKDHFLSYPYESMDPFISLIRQASKDPEVTSIKITLYRIARKSRLIDYLCQAAENGKDVDVLIELKARFDEQNNIDYSERLEDAGCTVLYGFEQYKVHSKICLISKMHEHRLERVVLIATGNFNENTAKQYTDLAYLTSRVAIVKEATSFFNNMMMGILDGTYNRLLVSPVSLKSTLLQLIEEETEKGNKGNIILKCNSITDEDIISSLAKASQAGVPIKLIIRGICCILPGIPSKTDNIQIISVVGRFLEHSRVFLFGSGAQEKVYISSADLMTRNTERRVEIAVPILDKDIKKQLHEYVDAYFMDNTKARRVKSNGLYVMVHNELPPFSVQQHFMDTTAASTQQILLPKRRESIRAFDTVYKKKKR